MNVNQAHYLGHQVDEPHQHPTKQLQTNCERCPTVQATGDYDVDKSRLLNQRRTQQDHWRSTHDTEDNIKTGRDVSRTDGSAVPPQQRSSQVTTAFMTDKEKRPDSVSYLWHDGQEQPARTVISRRARASHTSPFSNVSLTN